MKTLYILILLFLAPLSLFANRGDIIEGERLNIFLYDESPRQDTVTVQGNFSVSPFDLKIISPSLGVRFYGNDIIFLSPVKNEQKMPASQLSFGNVQTYIAGINDSTTLTHQPFSPFSTTPFDFPSDGVTFSADGKTMFFTGLSKTDRREKIFKAERYVKGKNQEGWSWSNEPLSFCTEGYRYTHPALSTDGRMMIFASDRSPSAGGMDLFVCIRQNDGWSDPEHLGTVINSKGNEMFPFLDNENNLYYSSDGLPGFGGYDIFISRFNGNSWEKPVNLSDAINTASDDIAFNLDRRNDTTGFLSRIPAGKTKNPVLYIIIPETAASVPGKADLSSLISDAAYQNLAATAQQLQALVPGETIPAAVHPVAEVPVAKDSLVSMETKKETPPAAREKVIPDRSESAATEKPATVEKKTSESKETSGPLPTKKTGKAPAEVKVPVTQPGPVVKEPAVTTKTQKQQEKVIYRVQFASSTRSKSSYTITVDGKKYQTFQYLYKGAYRQCVGDFTSLEPAKKLQNACRRSGYPQAFVVVFVNGKRTVEPKYFR